MRCTHQQKRPFRKGVAATELALLLPFLMFLFLVAVDFSRIFYFSIVVANCARNGAIYGRNDSTTAVDTAGIESAVRKDAVNLNPTALKVFSVTDNAANPSYVEVTVTYPFNTIASFPGIPSSYTLTRKLRMQVVPLVPAY